MGKILLLQASMSGNTEQMAEIIKDYLELKGHEVVYKTFDFDDIDVAEIGDYDALLIGCYTWDDGELPYEVEDFYEELEDAELKGMPAGVFGSADSFYDSYGTAVDTFAMRLENLGAVLLPERLKVDLEPDDEDVVRCQKFATTMSEMIGEKLGA